MNEGFFYFSLCMMEAALAVVTRRLARRAGTVGTVTAA